MPAAKIPRTVVVLGCVALLNDAASEMIAPLLPIFLTATLGAGPAIVGLVEGVAEATASVLKLVSGRLSDRGWGAKNFVLGGYGLSNAARPFIGLALTWPFVMLMRFLDRIGKGLRTAPRDAFIAGAADPSIRGRAFGFHASMDHAGAVIGPLAAFALLASGLPLSSVFTLSIVPGIGVMLLVALGVPRDSPRLPPAPATVLRWRTLDARIKALVAASGGLAMASVPEVLVVLWARDAGLDVKSVPLLWAAASLAKMCTAWPAGMLSDRIGRAAVLAIGWSLRVAVLLALALAGAHGVTIWVLFVAYSMSLAFTESAERSLIGDHAPPEQRGTAFGYYHLMSSLLILPGAVLFGAVWQRWGSSRAFVMAACFTAIAALTMFAMGKRNVASVA